MGLEEFAAMHPVAEADVREMQSVTAAALSPYLEDVKRREEADLKKQSILALLKGGSPPETVLYTALETIGLLTNDEAWSDEARGILDSVYSDLDQQSVFVNTAEAAVDRLEAMQADYERKTRSKLKTALNGCSRLEDTLRKALNELDFLCYSAGGESDL